MSSRKEYFFFATEVVATPPPDPADRAWWYFVPESGQHITFESKQGLEEFRKILGFDYFISFGSLHVLSRSRLKFVTRLILNTRSIRSIAFIVIPEILNLRFSLAVTDKASLIPKISRVKTFHPISFTKVSHESAMILNSLSLRIVLAMSNGTLSPSGLLMNLLIRETKSGSSWQ